MLADEQLIRQVSQNDKSPLLQATFAPVNKSNLSHLITNRLIKAIEEEEVKPGEKLPSEKELMALFEVGRSSVREALHTLSGLKLVEVRAGKGYYVREPGGMLRGEDLVRFIFSEDDFLNVMEVREIIEPQIAILAAQRALPEDLQQLEDACSRVEKAIAQGLHYYSGNIHLGIARATHNPVFIRIMEALLPLFPSRVRGRTIPINEELRMHRGLVDGLRTGDGKLMERLMVEHLRATREFYLTAIKSGGSKHHSDSSDHEEEEQLNS